jgi:hypothetical protein
MAALLRPTLSLTMTVLRLTQVRLTTRKPTGHLGPTIARLRRIVDLCGLLLLLWILRFISHLALCISAIDLLGFRSRRVLPMHHSLLLRVQDGLLVEALLQVLLLPLTVIDGGN